MFIDVFWGILCEYSSIRSKWDDVAFGFTVTVREYAQK